MDKLYIQFTLVNSISTRSEVKYIWSLRLGAGITHENKRISSEFDVKTELENFDFEMA